MPVTLSEAGGLSGSGTTNYLPKWTPDGFTLGDSLLYSDSNGVAIGSNSPNALFEIKSSSFGKKNILLSGNDFFGAGSQSGSVILNGINLNDNKQIWFGDASKLAVNSSNPILRVGLYGTTPTAIDSIATDGTPLHLTLNNGGGNVGIGMGSAVPTSKLQVVGLPTYADNAAAVTAGLTAGAFYYRTGHGLDIVI